MIVQINCNRAIFSNVQAKTENIFKLWLKILTGNYFQPKKVSKFYQQKFLSSNKKVPWKNKHQIKCPYFLVEMLNFGAQKSSFEKSELCNKLLIKSNHLNRTGMSAAASAPMLLSTNQVDWGQNVALKFDYIWKLK